MLRFPANGTKKRTHICGGTADAVGMELVGVATAFAMGVVTVLEMGTVTGICTAGGMEDGAVVDDGEIVVEGMIENVIAATVEIVVPAGGIELSDTATETVVAIVVPSWIAPTADCAP